LADDLRLRASPPLKRVRSALPASPPRPSCSATLPPRASEDYDIADLQDSLDNISQRQARLMREHADIQALLWDFQHKFRIFSNKKGKKAERG